MILFSGDIGGTHTRVQLTEFTPPNKMQVIASAHYDNSRYKEFLDIVDTFFTTNQIEPDKIASVCFGVAGPIIAEEVKFTNFPWVLSTEIIKRRLKLEKVKLINDFVAIGYGLETLQSKDLLTLQKGRLQADAIRAYIGAGTGLGIGFITPDGKDYLVHATEGGHVDFAPTDQIQIELLQYLRKQYHRVSFERLLSGQGLVNIYRFVADREASSKENADLRLLIAINKKINPAGTIAKYAIEHKDAIAMQALDIFIRIYGAAVGNLALTTLPFGGLYVVGGIAPKLAPQIKQGGFLATFGDKGRMSSLITDIPLHLVLYEDVGLQGAAVCARKIALE